MSRARITQMANLLRLVTEIQEEILELPETAAGGDPVFEKQLRGVLKEPTWAGQRGVWT